MNVNDANKIKKNNNNHKYLYYIYNILIVFV